MFIMQQLVQKILNALYTKRVSRTKQTQLMQNQSFILAISKTCCLFLGWFVKQV